MLVLWEINDGSGLWGKERQTVGDGLSGHLLGWEWVERLNIDFDHTGMSRGLHSNQTISSIDIPPMEVTMECSILIREKGLCN